MDRHVGSPDDPVLREASDEGVFIRQSTGLVRRLGVGDTLIYNAQVTGILLLTGLTILWVPFAYPGANLWLAFLLAGLFAAPMIGAYALLAVTIPRSGGDYVFQSRLLHPAIGAALTLSGYVIWMAFWESLNGWLTAQLAISPISSVLGVETGWDWLNRFAAWSVTDWGITIISLIGFVVAFVVLARGIRPLGPHAHHLRGAVGAAAVQQP
jgi:amino acid transporter